MARRQVLLLFHHLPFGSIYYAEGLRLAMGVATMNKEDHTVDIVYSGDGVNFALQGVDRAGAAPFLSTLLRTGCVPKVEEESLAARGINKEDVATDMEIISRQQVKDLVGQADFVMDF